MKAQELINKRKFHPNEPISLSESEVVDLLIEYARMKCKEQRQIICKEIFNADNIDIDQIARLVAEPEIE